jgi:hypothetical protein
VIHEESENTQLRGVPEYTKEIRSLNHNAVHCIFCSANNFSPSLVGTELDQQTKQSLSQHSRVGISAGRTSWSLISHSYSSLSSLLWESSKRTVAQVRPERRPI